MANSDIVILGGRGMLGTDAAGELKNNKLDFEVFDLPECDVTDRSSLEKAIGDSSIIINCAAYTNVEYAETESELAFKVNAEAVGNIAGIAKANNAWLLHISTDFVFDGELARPYVETDEPNPLSVYGKSKLAGEKLLAQSGANYCLLRLEWTYGHNGNNFVKKIIELSKKHNTLKVVDDEIGSPTATVEIAKVIYSLLEKKPEGIFHYAGAGFASRYEMAKFIFETLGIDVELNRCSSDEFETAAKRPASSRFDCTKISNLLDAPIESWQGPLEEFLRQL